MSKEQDQFRVSALDFDGIKNSFKEYLRGQDKFLDYDFEGSAMNILLDVLAYNTHYQAFYNNMAASEMFLDSSSIRSSAVSIAKQLGYSPRSRTSSYAKITLELSGETYGQADEITIPEYSLFKTSYNTTNYTFHNLKKITAKPSQFSKTGSIEKYKTDEFYIYEGKHKETGFVNDGMVTDQRFVIENVNIDSSTIKVYVYDNVDSDLGSGVEWSPIVNITELNSLTEQYSVEETVDGFFELHFGDGIVGKKLVDGNTIEVHYLVSNGGLLNGAGKTFTNTLGTVEVINNAVGGGEREDIDSIKFTAPKAFATQERAVTTEDYKALVLRDFPNIETVEAWGGQDNDPPSYGRVFLSIKPKEGTELGIEEKQAIITSLTRNRNVVGVVPEVVDPELMYILVDVMVQWQSYLTKLTYEEVKDTIRESISNYRDDMHELGFRGSFVAVDLNTKIKESERSITSVNTKIKIQKRISLEQIGSSKTTIKFNTIIEPVSGTSTTIGSNLFSHRELDMSIKNNCYLCDDGKGTVEMKYMDEGTPVDFSFNVGVIDYTNGTLVLNNKFVPFNVPSNELIIDATPKYNNVLPKNNILLNIDSLDINSITVDLEETK